MDSPQTKNSQTKLSELGLIAKQLTSWLKDFVLLVVGVSVLILLPKVSTFMSTTTATVDKTGQAVALIGDATVVIEQKAADQDARIIDIEEQLQTTVNKANTAIDAATLMLNTANETLKQGQQTIPEITNAVRNANTAIITLNEQEQKIGGAVDAAHQTISALNLQTLPKFNQELDEVHTATIQATSTLTNADEAMGHVNHVAMYYDQKLTKVKTLTQTVLRGVASFTIHLAADIVALAAFHQFP